MNVWSFEVVFSEETSDERTVFGLVLLAGVTLFKMNATSMDINRNPEGSERRVMEQFAEKLASTLRASGACLNSNCSNPVPHLHKVIPDPDHPGAFIVGTSYQ